MIGAKNGDRTRLLKELDELKAHGITNLRILVGAEGGDQDFTVTPALQTEKGKYNQELLDGLDFVLAEMGKRDLNAILYLNNNYNIKYSRSSFFPCFFNNLKSFFGALFPRK